MRAREKGTIRALAAALLLGLVFAGLAAAETAKPQRIVSVNACTDQLLLALADREQITALTHYAANPALSIYVDAVKAEGIKLIRGDAEEVLKLKPDLVLIGSFTRLATRQRLKDFGIQMEVYAPAESIEAAKAEIIRTAKLIGREARGEALIAEIDGALAEAQAIVQRRSLTLLQLRRSSYVSGAGTLFDDVLDKLGALNAGRRLGVKGTRQASLEAILKLKPDVLVMFDDLGRPGDQGAAFLHHPALEASFPAERRIVLPGNQIVCGGPSLPLLIHSLAAAMARLQTQQAVAP